MHARKSCVRRFVTVRWRGWKPLEIRGERAVWVVTRLGRRRARQRERHGRVADAIAEPESELVTGDEVRDRFVVAGVGVSGRPRLDRAYEHISDREAQQNPASSVEQSVRRPAQVRTGMTARSMRISTHDYSVAQERRT